MCQPGGDLGAVVLTNDVEAEVDAGRAAGRRQDVTLVDIEDPRVDGDRRVVSGQVVALRPVGGRPPAVEQTCLGENEGPGAQ